MFPYHVNDPEFVTEVVNSFIEICKNSKVTTDPQAFVEPYPNVQDGSVSMTTIPCHKTVPYSLSDFPDAKPGQFVSFLL